MSAAIGVDAGARLDRLPFCAFHRRIILLIGTGMFLDACDIYMAPGVLSALIKSGWSDLATNATFLSATFIGMLIGTISSGLIGDRLGRRFSYQFNLLIFGGASVAAAFAPNMAVLIGLRFLMGIGMGAEIVIGYSTLSEFMPRAVRGRTVAILSALTNTAVVATGFGGLWIIPTFGWQYMFGIVGVAALLVWVMRKNMPESPRWLESRGRASEADALLRAIEAEAAKKGALPPVEPGTAAVIDTGRFSELFGPDLIRSTILGTIVGIVGSISLYGFLSWVPTFLVKQGLSLNSSLASTALMGLGAPLGGLLAAMLADRTGRIKTLVTLTLLQGVLGVLYVYTQTQLELVAVGFGLTLCAYALVALGFGLYIPELFPTRLRLRGVSVANSIGRLAGAGIQFVIVALFTNFGVTAVAAFLVGALLVQAIALVVLGRETQSRALEDIEVMPASTAPAEVGRRLHA
ncbi:MFS transporter [Bradyrhizobium macuxiense]|uniref:MFS transporter n=1 Tax=Bradyrhizobium macuxiense TaxID=1755647 RepID=A0A109JZB0_9BRAD|nr:MFS transporter [Bradyrhizobium macuxiense]KWV57629.1 MFS transporter [Bradyrhizobium macuxiense]